MLLLDLDYPRYLVNLLENRLGSVCDKKFELSCLLYGKKVPIVQNVQSVLLSTMMFLVDRHFELLTLAFGIFFFFWKLVRFWPFGTLKLLAAPLDQNVTLLELFRLNPPCLQDCCTTYDLCLN